MPAGETRAVFVDESACIGCRQCTGICPDTFAMVSSCALHALEISCHGLMVHLGLIPLQPYMRELPCTTSFEAIPSYFILKLEQ